jgi:inner membrane protein
MYRSGHLGVSLVFAAVTVGIAPTPTGFVIALLIVATERIPDYDLRTDLLSHRGFSHTVWFALLVAAIFGAMAAVVAAVGDIYLAGFQRAEFITDLRAVYPTPRYLFAVVAGGTVLGIVSHLVADFLTVGEGEYGVQPLWPVWPNYEVPIQLCRADSYVANLLLLALGVITTVSVAALRLL